MENFSVKNRTTFFSNYEKNNLLRIIILCGIFYVAIQFFKVNMFLIGKIPQDHMDAAFKYQLLPVFAIERWDSLKVYPWTLFTYMFGTFTFMEWVTSMLWLYAFGNVVQRLIGRFEIYPIFLLSNMLGGLAYITMMSRISDLDQYGYFVGAQAATVAFAIAGLTLSPSYNFHIGNIKIPLWLLIIIYLGLSFYVNRSNIPMMALMGTGAVVGFLYIKMLQTGFAPGKKIGVWMENFGKNITSKEKNAKNLKSHNYKTPEEQELDRILEKMNIEGYQGLTKAEREFLNKASE